MKKSIFFELDYRSKLKVRHTLDVMSIEKSLCENIIGTLLDLKGKTKDTKKDRLDLAVLGLRRELHLQLHWNRLLKPPASYSLPARGRPYFCRFLKHVKLPDAYPVDLSKNISVQNATICCLEAYDCHVILQRLLPIAAHVSSHKDIVTTLNELSTFFQKNMF